MRLGKVPHGPAGTAMAGLGVLVGAGVLAAGVTAAPPAPERAAPTPEQARFFEGRVRPMLLSRCGACHGPDRQSGGLRVDSLAALLKGGSRGPALLPGNAEESLLLRTVAHSAGVPRMPPSGALPAVELKDLRRWIDEGAAWPAPVTGQAAQPGAAHWSFQPVRRPVLPRVKNTAWVKTPIDAFILAALEKQGLRPSRSSDRRTLLRRVTFDLTGLPPTPAEVNDFVRDRSAEAWPKVVERLLASPAYGECWGRHWLDVARYADTNGMDENVYYGNAWRYRDYVVQSFNADKPYHQFLREQIAGDLLPAEGPEQRREQLVATGFLAIGPKVISEVDDLKMEMDTIDEQVDTLGRATMGLTIGCARCHDHKFDPVSQADYYGLAGIFKSSKFIAVWKKPRLWFEHEIPTEADLARKSDHAARLETARHEITRLTVDATEMVKGLLPSGAALPKNPESMFPPETQTALKAARAKLAEVEKAAPEMPSAIGLTEGTPTDLPIHIRGDFLNLGAKVERRFPTVLAGNRQPAMPQKGSGRLELAQWLTRPEHPLTARVMVNRVWRWHFGQGLVKTTDNFGLLGEKPSHPELLDYLAARFSAARVGAGERESGRKGEAVGKDGLGWSVKDLHRMILLSSTYQQSSAAPLPVSDPKSATRNPKLIDPENRLLWRWEPRRLEAEELRDSLLFVSKKLDRKMGGGPLALKNREYLFDHTSKDLTKYDSVRRSLYLPIVRNHLYDVFQLFDFGDGAVLNGDRPTTTVPSQALFLMNSDLVMDSAIGLAASVNAWVEITPASQLKLLYETAYGRLPTEAETTAAFTLLAKLEQLSTEKSEEARRKQAWAALAHTLLASNEFVYLR